MRVVEQGSAHEVFVALLPRIQTHAALFFRHLRCPATRADRIAECVALAWQWLLRLRQRGKDVNDFKMVFVYLVARAVKSGRRVTGMEKRKDVLSERSQRLHGFQVREYFDSQATGWEERLRDNVVTPPPDAAAFRIDFPNWRATHTERDQRLIDLLLLDTSTREAAQGVGVSASRVSQKRREFHDGWQRFHGEEVAFTH